MSATVVELARAAYERRSKALGDAHLRPWELLPARAREQEVEEATALLEEAVVAIDHALAAIRARKDRP